MSNKRFYCMFITVIFLFLNPVLSHGKPSKSPTSVAFFEFVSTDLSASKNFFTSLFGWTIVDSSTTFATIIADNAPIGGLTKRDQSPGGGGVTLFFNVDRVSPYHDKAIQLGGYSILAPMLIPGTQNQWIAIFSDLDGNPVGVLSEVQ